MESPQMVAVDERKSILKTPNLQTFIVYCKDDGAGTNKADPWKSMEYFS